MAKKISRLPAVKAKTGLSRSTIYELMAAGRFPKSVKLGPKSVGWVDDEVDEYIDALIAARDAA